MTGGVFLSYSSRDRALLDNLLSALRRADENVWFDEKLGGGDVWWQKILERIRDCDVFLIALTNNSLQSKPCLAELRYAQALQKPVLPVQIGPVQSMRVTPVATVEAIDFQKPSADSGIRLITALQRARQRNAPLPSPLPEEPPVPFAYLMRLAGTVTTATELSPAQQTGLLAELVEVVAQDGDDTTTHADIAQLLTTLRDRPDATEETRTESEHLLAELGRPDTTARPPHPAGAKKRRTSQKWIIAAAAAIGVITAAVIAVSVTLDRPAPTAAVPLVASDQLESLLLSATEVAAVMGATDMRGDPASDEMFTYPTQLSDPDCLGADYAAAEPVYNGSGWSAVSSQILTANSPTNPGDVQFWVSQAAVSFPTDGQARRFLDTSAGRWKECAGRVVKETADSGPSAYVFGEPNRTTDTLSQVSFREGGKGAGCQHTLTVYSNSVLEVVACGPRIKDEAARIVGKMVDNARS